ncbi:MAG: hypothetical protein PHV20_05570 [Bacteroidales bacterium]|nr:hypothetical protein [Bacteroidales bacterium]
MKIAKLFVFIAILATTYSCINESEPTPKAMFELSGLERNDTAYVAFVGESFKVVRKGSGEFYTLYEGTTGKVFGASGALGVDFNHMDSVEVLYSTVGVYNLTVVATSTKNFADKFERDFKTEKIVVLDRRNQLSNFSLFINNEEYKGIIGGDNRVEVSVPDIYADSLSNALSIFMMSSGSAKAFIGTEQQFSNVSRNNFKNDLVYTIKSATNTTNTYTINVKTYISSSEKQIKALRLGKISNFEEVATIDEPNKTISIVANYASNLSQSNLVIDNSVNSIVYINGDKYNPSGSPKKYNLSKTGSNQVSAIRVVAQNRSEQTYTLNISQLPALTKFTFIGLNPMPEAQIDIEAKTVTIDVLKGTDITKLVASWEGSVGTVKIGTLAQANGVTVTDFTTPKVYTFYKGTTSSGLVSGDKYTVTVNVK